MDWFTYFYRNFIQMKIVADEHIPLIENYFGEKHTIIKKSGRTICRDDLCDADILLVRSVTKVNAALLENTPIQFVGSATVGTDHLDITWLEKNGIRWAAATGCNTEAVVNYVLSVIAAAQKCGFLQEKNLRAGIVGVGRIGSAVAKRLQQLGFTTLLCDPFRLDIPTVDFAELTNLDLISFHTPLTTLGLYPTLHLADTVFFQRQKKNTFLLNTARGDIVDENAVKNHGHHLTWCLDVFPHEPFPDTQLLENAWIATPHIAGYTVDAKRRGTAMLYDAAIQQGILPAKNNETLPPLLDKKIFSFDGEKVTWQDVVLAIFDPLAYSDLTKETLADDPKKFDLLRKNFPERREFSAIEIHDAILTTADAALLQSWGMDIDHLRST